MTINLGLHLGFRLDSSGLGFRLGLDSNGFGLRHGRYWILHKSVFYLTLMQMLMQIFDHEHDHVEVTERC